MVTPEAAVGEGFRHFLNRQQSMGRLYRIIDSKIRREPCGEGEETYQRCFQQRVIGESRVEEVDKGGVDVSMDVGSSTGSVVMGKEP